MLTFSYESRNRSGALIKGHIQAIDENQAADLLLKKGLIPFKIKVSSLRFSKQLFSLKVFTRKIRNEELSVLCRQLYSLTKAGVPIVLAIERLSETITHHVLKRALQQVSKEISSGIALSMAMQHQPKVFSPLMTALITAGEANGRLDEAFLEASRNYELENTSRRRVKAALRYPALVISIAFIAMMLLNLFVIPKFAGLYTSLHAALPLPTRILMSLSFFVRSYWWLILLSLFFVGFLFFYGLRHPSFRVTVDGIKLKLPIFGSILERIIMANFSRNLAMLLQTGVPLIQALTLVANVVGNDYAKEKILAIRQGIERGESFSQASHSIRFFSPLILQMLAVGEQTGRIDQMLAEVSHFYEQEVDYDIKKLTDKIEPLLLLLVGAMVLVLALGVFLPMWNLTYAVH